MCCATGLAKQTISVLLQYIQYVKKKMSHSHHPCNYIYLPIGGIQGSLGNNCIHNGGQKPTCLQSDYSNALTVLSYQAPFLCEN